MSLDFVRVKTDYKQNTMVISPEFNPKKKTDLMVKGKEFYAFYNEKTGLWSKDEEELFDIIDDAVVSENREASGANRLLIENFSSGVLTKWHKFCREIGNNYQHLDSNIIFADTKTTKGDYASKKLSYSMRDGDYSAYDELIGTLYDKTERRKIEWAIGSIISGDSKEIQKFYVFYGTAGSGKSTVMQIINMLFDGYTKSFSSKALGDGSNRFALEPISDNPLVAIDSDGDLSKINDNTRLNSIVAHDIMSVDEKNVKQYTMQFHTTLFIGSNRPVKITDAKSGLMRRLIDISPSGRLVSFERYQQLMTQIRFELGAIAHHCLQVYEEYGKDYYNNYKPTKMMDETNDMYNFVKDMLWKWSDEESITLAQAWSDYNEWAEDAGLQYKLLKRVFKAELKEYFDRFEERDGSTYNVFYGLKKNKFKVIGERKAKQAKSWLTFEEQHSLLDDILKDCKAQYANDKGIPSRKWVNVRTKLHELDTSQLHYVKPPKNLIVIDFDIKNDAGEKDTLLNVMAASKFPQTYAELSKSGTAIHLHYYYEGDIEKLENVYDTDIEVKVFKGDSALRRKVSKCNDIPITTINSGLPLKGDDKNMIDAKSIANEEHLIALIRKSLRKENVGYTKPEMDFIKKLTDDAYANEELVYDIRNLKPKIITFAMGSSNQKEICLEIESKIHYCSKSIENDILGQSSQGTKDWNEAPIVFYDVEVFPNLFIICWKKQGEENKVVQMINPTPEEVHKLFSYRLIGFNNRRYDNHIIYARKMGYSNIELFKLSQRIISKDREAFFANAYGLSYTDVLDYCSNANKMGLKKWEIKLGIFHLENAHPWDKLVDEQYWQEIADYCSNDVIATEAVFNATQGDFKARQILAELSGKTVNDSTNTHTQQIIFGNDKNPQREFNYPDLSKEFPGYEFKGGKSYYMGELVGEGGWVFAKPGMYFNAKVEDVSGMHPASIYAMNLFGNIYTERFYDLVRARTCIKHGDLDKAKEMFDGKLAQYLDDPDQAEALSNALKTAVNSVYGLTCASFPNRCKDPRNKDNVVAKRGALFMITLKNKVEEMGYTVIHCKTDSIKVANPDNDILDFIVDFGKQYGYTFEVEDEFERICLVNGSTFIARDANTGKWKAKAAQFAHPYVFKSLFTHEDIEYGDLCETKNTSKGALYLDMNERRDDVSDKEKELKKYLDRCKKENIEPSDVTVNDYMNIISAGHDYHFVGRVGQFTPVVKGADGGELVVSQDGIKYDAVQGTKGYRWLESEMIMNLDLQDKINMDYFDGLCQDAIENISNYGDFDIFVNADEKEFADYIEMRDSDYEAIPF